MPWASRFAWFQVRKFRMYQARRRRHVVALSDEALEALSAERQAFEPAAGRGPLLEECVKRLAEADRLLLRQRYDSRTPIREIARLSGVEPAQLYKRLERIRRTLLDCVNQAAPEERDE
jgi:DNA-directed RNA polymerase specialized sigma24 family protein